MELFSVARHKISLFCYGYTVFEVLILTTPKADNHIILCFTMLIAKDIVELEIYILMVNFR